MFINVLEGLNDQSLVFFSEDFLEELYLNRLTEIIPEVTPETNCWWTREGIVKMTGKRTAKRTEKNGVGTSSGLGFLSILVFTEFLWKNGRSYRVTTGEIDGRNGKKVFGVNPGTGSVCENSQS